MMSQAALSPSVMANIARMVAQQLQQNGVVNNYSPRPSFLGPATPAQASPNVTPAQGQLLQIEDGNKISRSLSSTSSYSASPSFDDDGDEDCAIVAPPLPLPDALNDMSLDYSCYSGKNKKSKFLPEDKMIVNDPILQALDPLFLAPLKSDLFRRQRVKVPDANGFRRLKKNPDIVLGLFKTLTKSTLRRLLRAARHRDQSPDLRQRYFYAALAVTTKRRANHIQSWRLSGGPLNFCYGGKDIYIAKYGPIGKVKKEKKTKKAATDLDSVFAMTADFSETDENASDNFVHVLVKCSICNDDITVTSTTGKKPPSSDKFTCVVCLEGGKGKCAGCGKFFLKDIMFPKCDKEFKVTQQEPKQEPKLRCNFCWQTLVKNKILPEMNVRCEKLENQKGKREIEIKKCKCGSTTHKTRNSRMCPLNKRYNKKKSTYKIIYSFRTYHSCHYLLC